MALSLAPLPSSSSAGNGIARSCRPLSASHYRPLRLPLARATPRLQLKAGARTWVASAPSPSPATLERTAPAAEAHQLLQPALHTSSPRSRSPASAASGLDSLVQSLEKTFGNSPNGELCKRWQEYHGCSNWAGLLEPLDPDLRAEIIKYGDLAQLTYDAFDNEEGSRTRGDCLYEEQELLQRAGLTWSSGYTVTKYIYASPDVHLLPKWLESCTGSHGQHQSSWIGFIAVATDEKEIARLGRRDIVVVWRGTVTRLEWLENIDGAMIEPLGIASHGSHAISHARVGVERGFHTLYTACNVGAPHGHTSASKQVTNEVKRLVDMYKGQESQLSITMTGHSLGGALALLAAYDVTLNCIDHEEYVPVSVVSFAAPRVGNEAFRKRLEEVGVKVLRVVNINDMVPKVPGILVHEASSSTKPELANSALSCVDSHGHNPTWKTYVHVGVELRLDNHFSPFLKKNVNIVDSHNLEVYLHLMDGYRSAQVPFIGLRSSRDSHHGKATLEENEAIHNPRQLLLEEVRFCMRFIKRDVTLVNKTTGLLLDELHVQTKWQEKKLPKPSPRFSPSTTAKGATSNITSHFVYELLHRQKSGINLSVA